MIAKIEIDCENSNELIQHLMAIVETIKIRSRGDLTYDFEVGTAFYDHNCYGSHEVVITPEL
jgi:hypothetical protein